MKNLNKVCKLESVIKPIILFHLFQLPMFNVDVLINAEEIVLEPSEQAFLYSFNKLMDQWDEAVTGIKPYLPDPLFSSFTE